MIMITAGSSLPLQLLRPMRSLISSSRQTEISNESLDVTHMIALKDNACSMELQDDREPDLDLEAKDGDC